MLRPAGAEEIPRRPFSLHPNLSEGLSVKKILLVEGPHPIDGLSSALFRRRECVLLVASSGAEALTVAKADQPDLVMYDARLTDYSPEEFVKALHGKHDEIPVIVIADIALVLRETAMLRSGASAVIFHPIDQIALNTKVCELVGISMRRHVRTFVKMKVDATIGAQTLFATISNVSLGGVLVDSERPMKIGDIIKLSFFLPGDDVPITVISKVVRSVGTEGQSFGCQFLDISDSCRHRIHSFVTASDGDTP
jgi:CheY-like chemotaxis protein